jgi:hypothetical protein
MKYLAYNIRRSGPVWPVTVARCYPSTFGDWLERHDVAASDHPLPVDDPERDETLRY